MSSQQPPKHDLLNHRTSIIALVTAVIGLLAVLIPVWNSGTQQSSSSAKEQGPTASSLETRLQIKPATPEPQQEDGIEAPTLTTQHSPDKTTLSAPTESEQPRPVAMKPNGTENNQKRQVIASNAVQAQDSGTAPVRKKPQLIKAAIPETKVPSELMKPLPSRRGEALSPEAINRWNSQLPGATSFPK